jgi:hypothetical protein
MDPGESRETTSFRTQEMTAARNRLRVGPTWTKLITARGLYLRALLQLSLSHYCQTAGVLFKGGSPLKKMPYFTCQKWLEIFLAEAGCKTRPTAWQSRSQCHLLVLAHFVACCAHVILCLGCSLTARRILTNVKQTCEAG